MLTDIDKTSTLWKNYKGFGSTHSKRETFEELYHAFNNISTNSVLTYGDLLPVKESDKFFEEISALDTTNDTFFYEESSFKSLPILRKVTDLKLNSISPNCNHAFVILDEEGNQIKNIIPFDYSDTGLYNYELKDSNGNVIPFGMNDWIVDTNSSLLTFNNGVPEGINAENPPTLSFYQYIGPVGERHYIEVVSLDVKDVVFNKGNPVTTFTEKVDSRLDSIEKGFFKNYRFGGNDNSQGIALQYNILSNAIDSNTSDPLKGFDDNSNNQVAYLLSHKTGDAENGLKILFVSETIKSSSVKIQVVNDFSDETGLPKTNISKVDTEEGFLIVQGLPGDYEVKIRESNDISAALLVKDNKTLDFELYYPREEKHIDLKVPVFVDMIKLPPHLKLESFNSYSDHITPQYYGPRTVDFVIAANDTSINIRSSDYVVYNKEKSFFSDALNARTGDHLYLRSGEYLDTNVEYRIPENILLEGESRKKTIIKNAKLILTKDSCLEKLTFVDSDILIEDFVALKMCDFINTKVVVRNGEISATILASKFEDLEVDGNEIIEGSNIINLKVTNKGSVAVMNSSISGELSSEGKTDAYSSFINEFNTDGGKFNLSSCTIRTLNATNSDEESIVNTTAINYVKNLPEYIKIDSSYVTKFSDAIRRPVYPDEVTIPFYTSFKQRVYAKTPKPFWYDKEKNEINLLLDTLEYTIFINKNGELQCRFFTSDEIKLKDPDAIKTQIEKVYGEHGDTVLGTEKPKNVEEAVIDLYWAKADLKNGKVPIDQLPDSVAHGGLEFVGMWSFEDSEGEYPTFADVDTQFGSDDEYTDLQNGWFFIVSSSHAEDDPVKPQYSKDGVEWTAGDWIIFSGGHTRKIDFTKPVKFLSNDLEIESNGDFDFTVTNNKPVKKIYTTDDSDDDSDEDSDDDSDEIIDLPHGLLGGFTINKEGVVTDIDNEILTIVLGIEVGQRLTNNGKLKVKSASYIQINGIENPWQKLDRSYLDPVYSRLPQLAVVSGGENPEWSIDDGGTGLLKLSYLSLAEAIRLINESLLKLSPDHPNSIRTIKVVLDEEKTTAKQKEYIEIDEGELDDFLKNKPKVVWDSEKGFVAFKQEGIHDQLPLEHCFYCGTKSDIDVFDGNKNITEKCNIERFDPYEKYRMGFRAPTVMDGAEITGQIPLGKSGLETTHIIKYSQYNLKRTSQVTEPAEIFEGDTDSFEFSEKVFYKMNEYKIDFAEEKDTNLSTINGLMSDNKTAGHSFIPKGVNIVSAFNVENFTKYNAIDLDAKVELRGFYGDEPLEPEMYSKILTCTDAELGVYDLKVKFNMKVLTSQPLKDANIKVEARVTNFGVTSPWSTVLLLRDIRIYNELPPEIVESGYSLYPDFNKDDARGFGGDYVNNKSTDYYKELMWENERVPAFRWPEKEKYTSKIVLMQPGLEEYKYSESFIENGQITKENKEYRFVTFKRSFEKIYDLCGFFIDFDWASAPERNENDGTLKDIILQVCTTSDEEPHAVLLDANRPITSAFFVSDFSKGSAVGYPGKSTVNRWRVSFGRKPTAVKDIYIRVGIAENTGIALKNVLIDTSFD